MRSGASQTSSVLFRNDLEVNCQEERVDDHVFHNRPRRAKGTKTNNGFCVRQCEGNALHCIMSVSTQKAPLLPRNCVVDVLEMELEVFVKIIVANHLRK